MVPLTLPQVLVALKTLEFFYTSLQTNKPLMHKETIPPQNRGHLDLLRPHQREANGPWSSHPSHSGSSTICDVKDKLYPGAHT